MKILNFGSMNMDMVYQIQHFVRSGETYSADGMQVCAGGKGLNQSIALAKAEAEVWHAGNIGSDENGKALLQTLKNAGVYTEYISENHEVTGHAIIQVNLQGENCIILYGGANKEVSKEQIETVFEHFREGDWLVLQNEINMLDVLLEKAFVKKMKVILNPSPMDQTIKRLPMEKVNMLILNEVEGEELTGEKEPEKILDYLELNYPAMEIVLTLGSKGSFYMIGKKRIYQKAYCVKAIDTTGAGDTFTGFLIAMFSKQKSAEEALDIAARASALAVTRKGAAASIPTMKEVLSKEY